MVSSTFSSQKSSISELCSSTNWTNLVTTGPAKLNEFVDFLSNLKAAEVVHLVLKSVKTWSSIIFHNFLFGPLQISVLPTISSDRMQTHAPVETRCRIFLEVRVS